MPSFLHLMQALMAAQIVTAHTLFSRLFIDGHDQGNGTCIRMPHDPSTATFPIADIASDDMACGVNGTTGVNRVCATSTSSVLTFEHREWPNDASKGSIDPSHKGPCAVYLKQVSDPTTDSAVGSDWFKIFDAGYNESSQEWCTETLIRDAGHLSVALPSGLPGGYYLVRSELLALQQADKTPSDPQFYVGCAQICLDADRSATPAAGDTVDIPGYVSMADAGLTYDIWTVPLKLPYPLPGPAVFAPIANSDASEMGSHNQTIGLRSDDCVLENANWCGIELSPYSTEAGCWNASTNCWNQCSDCYASAPPTGSVNCPIWEAKCTAIQQACNAGDLGGPPNYMKQLTPPKDTIPLPAPMAVQTGGGSYLQVTTASATRPTVTNAGSSTSSSTAFTATPTLLSVDGSCGPGKTCQRSIFGNCCSSHGWCGSSADYCGAGCESAFGTCSS